MCGRFLGANPLTAATALGAVMRGTFHPQVTINYNAAPTQTHLGIVQQDKRYADEMQWGWHPPFMKGGLLVNGKAETAPYKRTFATAFKEQRCVIPAAGFYEWKTVGKAKLPYLFRIKDHEVCGIAALWDDELQGETWQRRFILLTTNANELIAPVHDRMAVLLDRAGADAWLDPDASVDDLLKVCRPFDASCMEAVPVSPLLNKVANNGPEVLIAPAAV